MMVRQKAVSLKHGFFCDLHPIHLTSAVRVRMRITRLVHYSKKASPKNCQRDVDVDVGQRRPDNV